MEDPAIRDLAASENEDRWGVILAAGSFAPASASVPPIQSNNNLVDFTVIGIDS